MNMVKDHAQKEGLQYLLTYADNNATEFFSKQGFNEKGNMPDSRWKDFIKEYQQAQLMQCEIIKEIDYVNIYKILRQQRDTIIAKILEVINKQIYPGLKFNEDEEEKREALDFDQIPGLREAGWTKASYEQVLYEPLVLFINQYILQIKRRKEF